MSELFQSLQKERRARLDAAMAQAEIDLLAVFGNPWRIDYLRYACGVALTEGSAAALVEPGGEIRLLVDSPHEAARIAAEYPDIRVTRAAAVPAAVAQAIAAAGGRNVALAPAAAMPSRLAGTRAAAGIASSSAMLERLMMIKSPAEIEAVRRAAVMADEGYKVFMNAARAGRREYQLVADVEAYYRSRGCPDNFQILGSGGVEVRGMHPPLDKQIAAGDMVTTELTPCIEGYYAQICRTLVVGRPTPAQQRAFAVYDEALEAGIAAVRPGVTAAEVARAENDVFRKYGLGEYVTSEYTRVRGHGLGLYTDSRPALLENVDVVLEEDMTIVVHPNTYHPEVGYLVHGDSVRITASGCEVLIKTPRELFSVTG